MREVAGNEGDKEDSQGGRLGLGDTWIRGVKGRMQSPWHPEFRSSQSQHPLLPGQRSWFLQTHTCFSISACNVNLYLESLLSSSLVRGTSNLVCRVGK